MSNGAGHHGGALAATVAGVAAAPPEPGGMWSVPVSWPSQRRRTASAQQQASTTVASRAGPAATLPPYMCGASDVHAVGWLMIGESGWLVTEIYVACQLASAAAPSSTTDGSAARTRNIGIRRHGSSASSTGSA